MKLLEEFAKEQGVELTPQQTELIKSIINKIDELKMRQNRSGKTFALQFADEYLEDIANAKD